MTSTLAPEVLLAGRYRLVHRLASGGMGQVWRAEDKVLGRPVAVKLLSSEFAEDRAFLDRFRTEARRTAALSHPGIASVFDYGETGEPNPTAYLVMELVEGAPLSAVLAREGRLDPERALDVVAQAALALGAAHRAGVVHRDVKPSNLLIRRDGVVKVTDFGIARMIGEAPRSEIGLVVGTDAYLSPEQVACRPVTPASDVYALGVVAYECLAGRRPFTGEHPVAVALAHQRHRPPPLPSDVPEPVRALVEQAMAKDARTRPAAVALADHAVTARTALLEERRRDTQGGGNGWPGGDVLPGIGGWPIVSSLAGAGTNAWSGSRSQHTEGLRAQAHTSDPEQETGEWAPVSALLTRAWSRRRRPLAVTAMLAVLVRPADHDGGATAGQSRLPGPRADTAEPLGQGRYRARARPGRGHASGTRCGGHAHRLDRAGGGRRRPRRLSRSAARHRPHLADQTWVAGSHRDRPGGRRAGDGRRHRSVGGAAPGRHRDDHGRPTPPGIERLDGPQQRRMGTAHSGPWQEGRAQAPPRQRPRQAPVTSRNVV